MSIHVQALKDEIKRLVDEAFLRAIADGALPEADMPDYLIERPADSAHGEFAVNAALAGARVFRMAPAKIAAIIADKMELSGTCVKKCEVAGPGFINFYAAPVYFSNILVDIIEKGEGYGRSDFGKGKRVMVEFVSANPTGPMHMGNARGGALGDCLAAVMDAAGFEVEREFYVNDAGNQIDKFALSLDVRYQQHFLGEDAISLPEDAYQGGDITDLAAEFANKHGDSYVNKSEAARRKALVKFALPRNIARMKSDLDRYRIKYDTWFYESALHKNGDVMRAVNLLTERGMTYEKDGAVWYKATGLGAEKDEVLIRANGVPTYFAADIAYHANKFARGFDLCVNVWGADHHGHVARMKGAMDAIGLDGSRLEVVLMQLVNLMQDGAPVRMSKRTGKAIQLADLLDEVSVDAARFFFNLRESTTQMDFDLGLAVQQDAQNPVYYVQYAHARICSLFAKYAEQGGVYAPSPADHLSLLNDGEELELIRHLADFTDEIIRCAESREPAGITRYCLELAAKYHKFYNSCRVIGEDAALTCARLTLCDCTRQCLANALRMLKVTAPERMEAASSG